MNVKSRLLLLEIFPMHAITMMTVVNAIATANTNTDTDTDANTTIQPYGDPPIVSGCGQVHIRSKKIVGGHEASFGAHPWHGAFFARLGGSWQYNCGSSLLNDRWVVTAAHCMYFTIGGVRTQIPDADMRIRLGEWKLYSTLKRFSHQDYGVESSKIHPQYSHVTIENDIAMLKLNTTVSFYQYIVPVCLPTSNLNIFGRTATVRGWGLIDNGKRLFPDVLQEIDVKVINNDECQKWYKEAGSSLNIYDVAICAGYKEGGRDACQGDSGGGLTTLVGGKHVLIGVVSWGVPCALPNFPGVYTYVQKFVPWMLNIMK